MTEHIARPAERIYLELPVEGKIMVTSFIDRQKALVSMQYSQIVGQINQQQTLSESLTQYNKVHRWFLLGTTYRSLRRLLSTDFSKGLEETQMGIQYWDMLYKDIEEDRYDRVLNEVTHALSGYLTLPPERRKNTTEDIQACLAILSHTAPEQHGYFAKLLVGVVPYEHE